MRTKIAQREIKFFPVPSFRFTPLRDGKRTPVLKRIKFKSKSKGRKPRRVRGLIILSDLDGLKFTSYNGIVKVNHDPGRDFLFLSPDERVVEVYATGFTPLKIILSEVGIKLESGKSWQLKITGTKTSQADKDLLEVVFQCSESDVYSSYGDFSPLLSKSKTISYKLPKATYTFRFFQRTICG